MSIRERKSRGKTVYCAQVRITGHPAESRTFHTRKLAQKWFDERSAELKYGHEDLATAGKTPSFAELNEKYGVLYRVSEWERNVLKRFVHLPIFRKPIASITDQDVSDLKTLYLVTKGIKPSTFQKYLRILRRPIKKARLKWGYKGLIDPFEDIGVKSTDKPRERTMSDDEYKMVCEYLERPRRLFKREMTRHHYRLLIDFALATCMRRSEIANCQVFHIKGDYHTLYIPKTKTNVPRTIPLSPRARAILKELVPLAVGGYIFPTTGKAIGKRWTDMMKHLGIDDLHFHDLRHTGLSRYDTDGFSKGELKLIGGHRTDKMLFRYLHADLNDTITKMRQKCTA